MRHHLALLLRYLDNQHRPHFMHIEDTMVSRVLSLPIGYIFSTVSCVCAFCILFLLGARAPIIAMAMYRVSLCESLTGGEKLNDDTSMCSGIMYNDGGPHLPHSSLRLVGLNRQHPRGQQLQIAEDEGHRGR